MYWLGPQSKEETVYVKKWSGGPERDSDYIMAPIQSDIKAF